MKLKHDFVRCNFAKRLAISALLGFTTLASAQSYSIDWFTIDGGGGTTTHPLFDYSFADGDQSAASGQASTSPISNHPL